MAIFLMWGICAAIVLIIALIEYYKVGVVTTMDLFWLLTFLILSPMGLIMLISVGLLKHEPGMVIWKRK